MCVNSDREDGKGAILSCGTRIYHLEIYALRI